MTGFTLGGGIGLYSRALGMNCDKLLEVEMLLADGSLVKANSSENPDLYWASRGGGGGNYGIVTELTMQLSPYYSFFTVLLRYPFTQFKEVLKVWQAWALYTDRSLTTEFRCSDGQKLDGNTFFTITGVFFATAQQGEDYLRELLQPVLIVGNPEVMIKETDYAGSLREFAGNGRTTLFVKVANRFVSEPFPEQAIDIMVQHLSEGDGQDFFSLDVMGGAINDLSNDATAFPYRQGTILWMLMTWRWNVQDQALAKLTAIRSFHNALQPFVPPHVYVNQPDIALDDYLQKYYDGNLNRLISTKNQYDSGNIFHYPQSIPTSL
jgi:FAD/FMN-containing dehydrogenase